MLEKAGIPLLGTPVLARYNAPFTPWFLSRNEAMVEIGWPVSGLRQD